MSNGKVREGTDDASGRSMEAEDIEKDKALEEEERKNDPECVKRSDEASAPSSDKGEEISGPIGEAKAQRGASRYATKKRRVLDNIEIKPEDQPPTISQVAQEQLDEQLRGAQLAEAGDHIHQEQLQALINLTLHPDYQIPVEGFPDQQEMFKQRQADQLKAFHEKLQASGGVLGGISVDQLKRLQDRIYEQETKTGRVAPEQLMENIAEMNLPRQSNEANGSGGRGDGGQSGGSSTSGCEGAFRGSVQKTHNCATAVQDVIGTSFNQFNEKAKLDILKNAIKSSKYGKHRDSSFLKTPSPQKDLDSFFYKISDSNRDIKDQPSEHKFTDETVVDNLALVPTDHSVRFSIKHRTYVREQNDLMREFERAIEKRAREEAIAEYNFKFNSYIKTLGVFICVELAAYLARRVYSLVKKS